MYRIYKFIDSIHCSTWVTPLLSVPTIEIISLQKTEFIVKIFTQIIICVFSVITIIKKSNNKKLKK